MLDKKWKDTNMVKNSEFVLVVVKRDENVCNKKNFVAVATQRRKSCKKKSIISDMKACTTEKCGHDFGERVVPKLVSSCGTW
jgi:hypothetical protein